MNQLALIPCPACGNAISSLAPACPQCGRPNALAGWPAWKKLAVGAFIVLPCASYLPYSLGLFSSHVDAPVVVPISAPALVPAAVDIAAEKVALDRDRTVLRKARPKTQADVEKLLGRRADECLTSNGDDICTWFYNTKPPGDGRESLAFTFRDGKVLIGSN